MKIAIFANNYASFVKPMAEGLERMLIRIGEEPKVFYNGWQYLRYNTGDLNIFDKSAIVLKDILKYFLNGILRKKYTLHSASNKIMEKDLRGSELIIVVSNAPTAFLKKEHTGIDNLRKKLGIPVAVYISYNVISRGGWFKIISEDYPCECFGLERYDWYLLGSIVGRHPMPESFDAFSFIGLDLRDGTLYPEKDKGFFAVLDFPRPGFENEREIQIQALQELHIPYIMLDRAMSINEIRKIYRKTCLYFLSFKESFGLPIVELQLCGSYICTPYKSWTPGHVTGTDIYKMGEEKLSKNFIVYNNDKELLKSEILRIKSDYNPEAVIREFANSHPHLYQGNLQNLRKFVDNVKNGAVTYTSHSRYLQFNNQIITNI